MYFSLLRMERTSLLSNQVIQGNSDDDLPKKRINGSRKRKINKYQLESWSFESHPLVRAWIRHQYLRPFFPLLCVCCLAAIVTLSTMYTIASSEYNQDEFKSHNCTIVSADVPVVGDVSCGDLDPETQFLLYQTTTILCEPFPVPEHLHSITLAELMMACMAPCMFS